MKSTLKNALPLLAIVSIVATASPFKLGQTCAPLKISVDGDGYLRLAREGRAVYAKTATITITSAGKVITEAGDTLLPTISAPANTQRLEVDLEGNILAVRAATKSPLGRLVLAIFPEGAVLNEKNGVLLAGDRPKLGSPGEGTSGVIRMVTPTKPKPAVETKASAPVELKSLQEPEQKPDQKPDQKPLLTGPIGPSGSKLEPAKAETVKPALKTGPTKIVALASAEVEGDHILLGEIAQVEADAATAQTLNQVDLGDAPILGAKRTVDRARILSRLKAAGFDTEKIELIVPATIEVKRKGQTITQAQFNYAALKAVYESTGIQTEYVPADEIGPDFLAPAGKFALVPETISGVNTDVATVKVAVYVGTARVNSRTIKLKAKVAPALVKSGAPVKVFFRAGGATVETQGIARSSGKAGDTISVEVKVVGASEKTLHSGTLMANGAVEVKL